MSLQWLVQSWVWQLVLPYVEEQVSEGFQIDPPWRSTWEVRWCSSKLIATPWPDDAMELGTGGLKGVFAHWAAGCLLIGHQAVVGESSRRSLDS